MNSYFALPLLSILFILSGSGYTSLISKSTIIEKIGLRFLLGSGLTTLTWFSLFRLGMSFSIFSFLLASVIVHCIGFVVSKLIGSPQPVDRIVLKSTLDKVLAGSILLLGFSHLLITSYNPITSWDSIALYDFAGRIAASSGNLNHLVSSTYYMSYPLYVSLSHAAMYLFGAINPQGLHSLILISFMAVIFGRLYSWTNIRYALLGTLLALSSYQIYYHASYAYTNIPYVSFLIIGYLYAVSGDKKSNSPGYLLLSSVMLGLSTWTRSSEPFWIVGVILLLWQGWRLKQIGYSIFAVVIMFMTRSIWTSYYSSVLQALNVEQFARSSLFNISTFQSIAHNYLSITWYILLNIIHPYLGAWLMFIPSIIIAIRKRDLRLRQLLLISIIIFGMVVGGIAVFSTYYTSWNEIGDSARRMVLFIIPLSIITNTYALYKVSDKVIHD